MYDSIIQNLMRYRIRVKLFTLIERSMLWLTLLVGSVLIATTFEAIFNTAVKVRMFLDIALGAALSAALLPLVFWPLLDLTFRKNKPGDVAVALRVGDHFPHIRDRLANALQVYNKQIDNPERYSAELMHKALADVAVDVGERDFAHIVDSAGIKTKGKIALSAWAFTAIALLCFGPALRPSFNRLLHPTAIFAVTPILILQVEPGNVEVLRGESLSVAARVYGKEIERALILSRGAGNPAFTEHLMKRTGENRFTFDFTTLRDTTVYKVAVEGIFSPEYYIAVIELPMVRALRVKIVPPAYSGLASQFLDDNVGDVIALKGSKVQLFGTMNKPVKKAGISFSDGSEVPLKTAGNNFEGAFTAGKDLSYHLTLHDDADRRNEDPLEYRISIMSDRSPLVRVLVPGEDVDVSEDMSLPLLIEVEDDFGISKVSIGYRLIREALLESVEDTQDTFLPLPLSEQKAEQQRLEYTWDLATLGMMPRDVVAYYAQVFDNDLVSGPKSGTSMTYRIRFPSIYEIYQEIAETQAQTFEVLTDAYEETKALKERLDEFVQQMKREPELDWGEKKEVEEALNTQKRLTEELDKLSTDLDEMIERMEKNDLVTLETLNKYRELQELFREVATPEMMQAMEEVQEALKKFDPEQLQAAVEKFDITQEEFLETLERTIELLKRLQIEQKLDEAVRKVSEMLLSQEEVNKKAVERGGDSRELAGQEQNLRQNAEKLSHDLEEISATMAEFLDMPRGKVDEASAMLDSTALAEQMQKLSEMLAQGNMKSSPPLGSKISKALHEVSQILQTAQQELRANQKKQVMEALQRVSHNLLRLSEAQEELMKKTRNTTQDNPQVPALAEEQNNMKAAMERVASDLYSLSHKTFYVPSQMGSALGSAYDEMGQAVSSLEQRNSAAAVNQQANAVSLLNAAVAQLLASMQELSSGSSGLGYDSFLQHLQQTAQGQQSINQETLALGPGGQFSLEQQAAMARLAAEQEALRKSLEALQREMGHRSEIPGRLDQIAQDMESVARDLHNNSVDRRTIDRQRRILSRLLDAQRSVRERDYSRQRQATTGTNVIGASPGPLPDDLGERRNRLQEDLLRAKKEGYTRDYLELIRLYFEALGREEVKRAAIK